ncbi:MAG: hypothetical protein Q9224_000979 [Gallowayella concinna]
MQGSITSLKYEESLALGEYFSLLTPSRPLIMTSEWYGTGRSNDPAPANAPLLQTFFPTYSTEYRTIWTPAVSGESIEELYSRCAYVAARMIQELDTHPLNPKSVLICTHAAIIPIIGRILTGNKPKSPTEGDFIPWTASLFTFRRCRVEALDIVSDATLYQALPTIAWENGVGIGGLWECLANGDCSFLSGGKERGWRFSGKESFDHAVVVHGLDAGTGLGVIV